MGNKYTTKNEFSLKTNKTCIYQIVQLNNVELATCSSEKNLDIWNLETGLIDITLTGYSTPVTSLVYMHDGRLATGSQEHSIKIWTYDTHRCDFTVMAHNGPIHALIQLKDHNLVSGSDDSTIKILDLSSMWFSTTFTEHKGPVNALAQLLDGRLVSGSSDKTIKIWNIKRKKIEGSVDIGAVVTKLLVVNNSGLLLVGCKKIQVFDMSVKEAYNHIYDLPGHKSDITNMINVGINGERVITSGKDGVKIWNIPNKILETKLQANSGGTYGMEILTDGRLVTSGGDGQLKIWNILADNGMMINLKTGEGGGDNKPVAPPKGGKVTYAFKDDVKKHDLAKIESNINQNKNKNNNQFSTNKNQIKNSYSIKDNKNTINNNTINKNLNKSNTTNNAVTKASLESKGWVFLEHDPTIPKTLPKKKK